jgi:hypothetical protein
MQETSSGRDQVFIAHDQATEMAQPTRMCARQSPTGQSGPQLVTVVGPIGNQSFWTFVGPPGFAGALGGDHIESLFQECDFRF